MNSPMNVFSFEEKYNDCFAKIMENVYDTSKKPNEKGFIKNKKGLKFYPLSQSKSNEVIFNTRKYQSVELAQSLILYHIRSKQEKQRHI